jgi:hypothetical protein
MMKLKEEKRVYINHLNPNDYFQQFYQDPKINKSFWR